jgi:RNA polymerase sigma-70 factor (ECF subfamily)
VGYHLQIASITTIDDPLLLARLREGDESAFEQLVRATMARLLAAARRLLRNEEEARDAVQTAFIRAFQSLSRFRAESTLSTWLHRIVVNECLMRLRSRKREDPIDEALLPQFRPDGHQVRDTVEWSDSAEQAMERSETAARVRASIDQLPEPYRTVLILRDVEEMTPDEVAEQLGLSKNVIKVRLHRARQMLRTLLEREFGEAP